MFSSRLNKALIILTACSLSIAACDKSERDDAAALTSEDSILRYVPADTPYVIAKMSPLPQSLMDKLEPKIDALLRSYQTVIREVVKARQAELSEADGQSADMARVSAVVDEVTSLMSIAGLEGAGISDESPIAFYGNGLLPVLRIGLSDGALFDATLSRIEDKAEYKLPIGKLGDQQYRYFVAEQAKIIIAVIGDLAVVTAVPASFDDALLGQVLGFDLPEKSIAETGALDDLAREFELTPHQIGLVDVQRLAARFIDAPSGLDAAVLALAGYDASELSDVCRAEIRSTAAIMPRIAFGYTELSAANMGTRLVADLRDDIAAGLAALPAAVPGLGIDQGGLMSFGVSMDFKAARNFYEARLDALETTPYECELFDDLQNGVAAGRGALNQPLPPIVYDFKGFLAVVDDIDGIDFASKSPPKSVDARILLAMDNAGALIALAGMFSPEIAAMNLQPDGKPVRLESQQLQGVVQHAFVAMTQTAIALSVGAGSEARLSDMLEAEATSPSPIFSLSMDAARYYSLIGDAMSAAEQGSGDEVSPEMQAALSDIMRSLSDLYDRITVDMMFTARGAEVDSNLVLGD